MVQRQEGKAACELSGSGSQLVVLHSRTDRRCSMDRDYSVLLDTPSSKSNEGASLPSTSHDCVHINTRVCRRISDEILRSSTVSSGLQHVGDNDKPPAFLCSDRAHFSRPCGGPSTLHSVHRDVESMLPTRLNNCASPGCDMQGTRVNSARIPNAPWGGGDAATISLPEDCNSIKSQKLAAVFCSTSVHARENTQQLYGGLVSEPGVTRRSRHSERRIEHRDRVEKFLYDLYQQQLPRSDLPFKMFRPKATFAFCSLWGFVLVSLGVALFVFSMDRREVVIDYSSQDGDMASIPFSVSKSMPTPVYVYYRIDGFYANFRAYVKDGPRQLSSYDCGAIKSQKEALEMRTIDGKLTLPELKVSVETGQPISEEAPEIFPCGAQSVAFFSDDFQIWKRGSPSNKSVQLDVETAYAAYEWDFLQFMVKNSTWTNEGLSPWILMNNPRFRVWMHPPFTPQFQKLYGFIMEPLEPGLEYFAVIQRNDWPADAWGAKKSLVLASLTPLGGPNMPLAIVTLFSGLLCWLVVLVLWLLKKFEVHLRSRTVIGVDLRKAAQRSEGKREGTSAEQSRWHNESLGLFGNKRKPGPQSLKNEAPVGETGLEHDVSQGAELAAKLPVTPSCVCPAHCHVPDPGRSSRALLDPSGPTNERDSRQSSRNTGRHRENELSEDEALSEDERTSSSREFEGGWGERASESEESGDSYRARKAAYAEEYRNS